jgi:hypothetical protein
VQLCIHAVNQISGTRISDPGRIDEVSANNQEKPGYDALKFSGCVAPLVANKKNW